MRDTQKYSRHYWKGSKKTGATSKTKKNGGEHLKVNEYYNWNINLHTSVIKIMLASSKYIYIVYKAEQNKLYFSALIIKYLWQSWRV